MTAMQTKMTEEQMVSLVRNALLVAGQEMGAGGDHWPIIKSTIHDIMKDWENLKVERNVFLEVKSYYEKMFRDLEMIRKDSPEDLNVEIDTALIELRSLYAACFGAIDDDLYLCDGEEDIPLHVKRAEAIIGTLGGNNEK